MYETLFYKRHCLSEKKRHSEVFYSTPSQHEGKGGGEGKNISR